MTRGRNICNTLKAIRKQIADANGIEYSPEECHFKGECKGTCPKCEQDVRDLEYELRLREMAGKAIKVAGIAAGLVTIAACSDGKTTAPNTQVNVATECNTKNVFDPTRFGGTVDYHVPQFPGGYSALEAYIKQNIEIKEDSHISAKFTVNEDGSISDIDVFGCTSDSIKQEIIQLIKKMPKWKPGTLNEKVIKMKRDISFSSPNTLTEHTTNKKEPKKKSKQGKTAIIQPAIGADSTENSKIFGAMEEMSSFPGGSAACMKYIADNLRYPYTQGDSSIQGRVILGFTVNEDGSLSDIKVMKSISPSLDEEAIRVVKSMPNWIPAKQNGKAVKTKYTLPVNIHWQ